MTLNIDMEDFNNIMKVFGYLVYGMAGFYIIFFALPPSEEEMVEDVLEDCVPLQYDFRIISSYEDRYYNFEGRTKEGRIVKFKIPSQWRLHDVCADGDSIHKLAGEKELYVIKPDTTIKLPLLVHGEEI